MEGGKLPQSQSAEMLSVEKIDEINDLIYRFIHSGLFVCLL